eukprot:4146103-Alexandrium_andersonii.AAC.1
MAKTSLEQKPHNHPRGARNPDDVPERSPTTREVFAEVGLAPEESEVSSGMNVRKAAMKRLM